MGYTWTNGETITAEKLNATGLDGDNVKFIYLIPQTIDAEPMLCFAASSTSESRMTYQAISNLYNSATVIVNANDYGGYMSILKFQSGLVDRGASPSTFMTTFTIANEYQGVMNITIGVDEDNNWFNDVVPIGSSGGGSLKVTLSEEISQGESKSLTVTITSDTSWSAIHQALEDGKNVWAMVESSDILDPMYEARIYYLDSIGHEDVTPKAASSDPFWVRFYSLYESQLLLLSCGGSSGYPSTSFEEEVLG